MPFPFPLAVLGLTVYAIGGGWLSGLFGGPATPSVTDEAIQTALAARWTPELTAPDAEGGTPLRISTRDVYAARSFRPLWMAEADREQLRLLLGEARLDGLDEATLALDRIDILAQRYPRIIDRAPAPDGSDLRAVTLAEWDALLTEGVLRYAEFLLGDTVDPATLYADERWQPVARPADPLANVRRALEIGDATALDLAVQALRPPHPEYRALSTALGRLLDARPNWSPIPDGDTLHPGSSSIRVPYVRSRLAVLGYLDAPVTGWTATQPYRFDSTLAAALVRFQADYALPVDTVLTAETVLALDVNPDSLIQRLRLNLERWRWLPRSLGDLHLLANLPAYELTVRNRAAEGGWRDALHMPAAIGMVDWATPVISDTLTAVVFNPTWTVPTSIQAADIIPQARADSGATLVQRGFSVFEGSHVIDPLSVDWTTAEPGQYRFVQRPGPANPLGRLKFVMPNEHAILIHDTNKPSHFEATVRAFSNGCIQAQDPIALAGSLLEIANGWPEDYIHTALGHGREQAVPLERLVPVHFVYFTAWPTPDGPIRYLDDVYGYDAILAQALADPESFATEHLALAE